MKRNIDKEQAELALNLMHQFNADTHGELAAQSPAVAFICLHGIWTRATFGRDLTDAEIRNLMSIFQALYLHGYQAGQAAAPVPTPADDVDWSGGA